METHVWSVRAKKGILKKLNVYLARKRNLHEILNPQQNVASVTKSNKWD